MSFSVTITGSSVKEFKAKLLEIAGEYGFNAAQLEFPIEKPKTNVLPFPSTNSQVETARKRGRPPKVKNEEAAPLQVKEEIAEAAPIEEEADLFEPEAPAKSVEEMKAHALELMKKIIAKHNGSQTQARSILMRYGVNRLTVINPSDLPKVLVDLENELAN
jgi:hypothetical protein